MSQKVASNRSDPVRIETKADYLKLVGTSVWVSLKQKDPELETDLIESAVVEDLSHSGARLILKNAVVKKWWFIKKHYPKCSVELDNISVVSVLDRHDWEKEEKPSNQPDAGDG